MTSKDFLSQEYLGRMVLSYLSKITKTELPKSGFLAGGSVSNMLLSLYTYGDPYQFVVNDLDVYVDATEEQINGPRDNNNDMYGYTPSRETSPSDTHDNTPKPSEDEYGSGYIIETGEYSNIIKTGRNGLLNVIAVEVRHNKPSKDSHHMVIIKTFDLNNTQSGIDLETGKLYFTKDFQEFLETKQMKIVLPHRPIQTAVRMVKKHVQMCNTIYCNFEEEFEYLHNTLYSCYDTPKKIGPITHDKFLKYRKVSYHYIKNGEILTNNIDMTEYFDIAFDRFIRLTPRDIPFGGVLGDIKNYFPTLTFSRVWDLLVRVKKSSHRKKIMKIIKAPFQTRQYETLIIDPSDIKISNVLNKPIFQALTSYDKFYDCDFTTEHILEIDDYIHEHYSLKNKLILHNKNVQEMLNMVRTIKSVEKREGGWVVGVVESNKPDLTKHTFSEWLNDVVEREKRKLSTPLIDGLDLEGFKYKDCVKELITPLDLKNEGHKMGHCVGGYSNNIEKGFSRIFNIEVDGIQSTLELRMTNSIYGYNIGLYKTEISVKQHYGMYPIKKGNERPTNKNRGVAFKLAYFLCKQMLTEEEFNSINKSKWRKILSDGHGKVRGRSVGYNEYLNQQLVI